MALGGETGTCVHDGWLSSRLFWRTYWQMNQWSSDRSSKAVPWKQCRFTRVLYCNKAKSLRPRPLQILDPSGHSEGSVGLDVKSPPPKDWAKNRGPKKTHKLFQHKLFVLHPKHPILGPQKKVDVPHFLGKDAKRGPTQTFSGGFGGSKRGSQTGHFGHKKFSLLFFLALKESLSKRVPALLGAYWAQRRKSPGCHGEVKVTLNQSKYIRPPH